jgi:hypothetical protein
MVFNRERKNWKVAVNHDRRGWRITTNLPHGIAIVLQLASFSSVLADSFNIDNFDRSNAPAPWVLSQSSGALGNLASSPGHSGNGMQITYSLPDKSSFVGANLNFSPSNLAGLNIAGPVTNAAAIGFWVRSPPNVTLGLRVVDGGGQTLEYDLHRPLVTLNTNAWYQHVVALANPTKWSGGTWAGTNGIFQYPITSISILAANPLDPAQPGATGVLEIDDVTALTSLEFNLDPTQALIPGPPASNDLLSHFGVSMHMNGDEPMLPTARAAGFSWARTDLNWASIETTPNSYNFSSYSNLFAKLQTNGMRALFILDYGNTNYTNPTNSSYPPTNALQIQAFGNFAQAAASYFVGKGVCFEVWNEPNGTWGPSGAKASFAQYAALLQPTIARIHQADPTATVVTGGLSYFDYNFLAGFLNLGGAGGADAIGVHPYSISPPEALTDPLMLYRAIVAQYFSNAPPIWDTEWGYSASWYNGGNGLSPIAEQRQAVLASRSSLSALAVGFPFMVYYDLRNDGTSSTNVADNYGLLLNDYSQKPVMQALRLLDSVATGRRFSGFLQTAPTSLTAMRFDGLTNLVVALWCSVTNAQVPVTLPTNATVTDLYGTALTNTLGFVVSETNGPIYVTVPSTWQATNLSPTLTASLPRGGSFQLDFEVPTGAPYSIQTCTNLVAWSTLTNLVGAGPVQFMAAPNATSSFERFFRIQVFP